MTTVDKRGVNVLEQLRNSMMVWRRWIALLCVVTLVAVACGDGNGDDGSGDTAGTTIISERSSDDRDVISTDATPAVEDTPVPLTPQYGGTLVVGLEAETTNGLNPVNAQAAVSGHIVFRALYDTLTIEGTDGEILPNLLESFSSNEDFSEWLFTLPPGIRFHDDTPADATALKRHFEENAKGILTGIVVDDWEVEDIQIVDDLTMKLVLKDSFASLPYLLSSHHGYFGAPSMHDLGQQGAARNPIGTGPFMLDEWIPNEVTRVVRNPNYWRTDAEGRSLPYLDAIEFRPISDSDGRFNGLRSGDLDAVSANTGLRVEEYNEQFKTLWQDEVYKETTFLLLNNSRPPFDNVEFRRALAQCLDVLTFNNVRWDGQAPASGPFSPGTPGYLTDSGYPTYDPAVGSATIARLGITEVEIGATRDLANLLNAELLAAMWGDCGLNVSITPVDQAELITNAVLGNFTAFIWRQHEAFNLGVERVWWHSKFGHGLALNFGRINNPAIDAALDEAVTTDDLERLRELAEDINRAFADQVHHLWFFHSNWLFATDHNVHGVDNLTLRGGHEHEKVFSGRVFLTEAWIEQ
ncbi:MAG: hypothetical protein F4138_00010 [Acidimicrobiia bacterium]|nr:hypothetical protein [Acidimicrobiia bacterium]